jgi:hypothetical protein
VPEPVADQQIELLVDLDDRIAELPSPDREGGDDQEDEPQPAVRRLFWSDDGNGTDLTLMKRALSRDRRRSSNVHFGLARCGRPAEPSNSRHPGFAHVRDLFSAPAQAQGNRI